MLVELRIRNFALIDNAELEFGPSLTLLTGETGAGKSILIDALGLVLGERSSGTDSIRIGADRLTVDAVFDLSGDIDSFGSLLRENDIELEDSRYLLIGREILRANARSICKINGRVHPVSILKEFGERLVDVHGQHEHQALLNPDRHLDLLDSWAGTSAENARQHVAAALNQLNKIRKEISELERDARDSERLSDVYKFQADEIENANLVPDEEQELTDERQRLANAERISQSINQAHMLISGTEDVPGVLSSLQQSAGALVSAQTWDPKVGPIVETLQAAAAMVEDAAEELRRYPAVFEYDANRLDALDDRIALIKRLKKKYGESIRAVIDFGHQARKKLDSLTDTESRLIELQTAELDGSASLDARCAELHHVRAETANDFTVMITQELKDLGMAATKFAIQFTQTAPTAKGADKVEFLISPNPGEPLRPLAKIASGGEMSRIMLAIKSVLVRSGASATMVFDEIDVGVGGRTGEIIGRKLQLLSERAQILCITHLPQIASRPGRHYYIEKTQTDDRTSVTVEEVSGEARTNEIARMLGGSRRSEAVVQNARELLQST